MKGARGSYQVERDFRSPEDEIARLGEQAALSWPREREVLSRLQIPTSAQLLDIGCGPGFILERLGEMYPEAQLTGIDPSPIFLKSARQRLSPRFGARLSLEEGGFGSESLPQGVYDLVLCRYVLQHMSDPLMALKELRAMVRPKGYGVVVEVDSGLLGVSEPFDPSLAEIYRRASRIQSALGGNRTMARQLVRLMKAAGFEDVRLDALVLHSDEYGIFRFDHQISPETVRPALVQGLISPSDFAKLQEAYERFRSNPAALLMSVVFLCAGRPPIENT